MSDPHSFLHPRDEILQTMERIYRYRMTTTSGGNISIREDNGDVWITPARVDKGGLRREDIVLVHPGGSTEGRHGPSSELPFHLEIYRARPDLRSIVHAHPVALVAFSLAHQVPDTRLFHQARHVCGAVGLARYALPGSEQLGRNIAETFQAGFDCAVLENHGIVTGGADLRQAFHRFETLEFTAKTIIKARLLGGVRFLGEEAISEAQQSIPHLPEFHRAAPTSAEKEIRQTLCAFVQRAYRQRLFISTQGTFSARLDATSFVITPYRLDRLSPEPVDLVLIRDGHAEAGRAPSRAAANHEAIYRAHPGIGAIINAYPVNATAFSVSGMALDSRTIPESYIVLREVVRIPFGAQFEDGSQLAKLLTPRNPASIQENDGVLVAGANMLEAFDRLEVLESTAEAIINCRAVGDLATMPAGVISELEAAFLM